MRFNRQGEERPRDCSGDIMQSRGKKQIIPELNPKVLESHKESRLTSSP